MPASRPERIESPTPSAVRLAAALIDEACGAGASDLHLDPTPAGMRVRLRVDGRLSDRDALPSSIRGELIARIKVLAGLRTDEHYAAQDGRFRHCVPGGGAADIRVSIAPTYHGESAVLRILADTAKARALDKLGFGAQERELVEEAIRKPDGMILVVGPTGSGKTTTLYAMIQQLNAPERLLATIEDPVEYAIDGIRQIQTQSRTGLTFAQGLRALLRQDPDVLMVGEIRDAETAGVAANAALTGHLLLSTLHANGAAAAIPRLLNLGVEPYLIAATLRLVIAQRLVRRMCPRGACEACQGTGYCGRMAIVEVMRIEDDLREAILARASAREIERIARSNGMCSMREDGLEKARIGSVSLAEVMSVL
jgi:type II secretory ATPase GspE/PulE/Tfp pilus assembly ATPase PilB-like protein